MVKQAVPDPLGPRLAALLPGFKEVRVRVVGPVAPGLTLARAHAFASALDIAGYETPKGLPRRADSEKTPEGLVRAEAECDTGEFRDARNEYYSYRGWFLSLLLTEWNREPWDARWERADY
ncbi:hypothetical protein EPO15_09675 [bacterium]|nr:MAG: hypothetical protein EPO15_09675 [bacterium]